MVARKITSQAKLDYNEVVRKVVAQIGLDNLVEDLSSMHGKGLSYKTCEVLVLISSGKLRSSCWQMAPGLKKNCEWVPKYGRWMVKSTPKRPYAGLSGVLDVEPQLQLRRARLRAALRPEEVAPALNHFPLLGVGDCSEPAFEPQGPLPQGMFVPDEVAFTHPRFPTLARNLQARRGSNVDNWRPKLKNTNSVMVEHAPELVPRGVVEADAIYRVYADVMPFRMGLSCVQVTMQAANILQSQLL